MMTLLCSGCVHVTQDLVLNPDGTGTLKILYGAKESDLQRMSELARQMAALDPSLAPEDVNWLTAFDENVIRREWNKMKNDGVKLNSVIMENREGWRYMKAAIRFDSLQKLIDTGMLGECRISLTRGPSGQYGYQQSFNMKKAMNSLPRGMEMVTFRPMMKVMMQDFRAEFRITSPGRIIRSNADAVNQQVARWSLSGSQADLMDRLENFDLRILFDGRSLQLADASEGR